MKNRKTATFSLWASLLIAFQLLSVAAFADDAEPAEASTEIANETVAIVHEELIESAELLAQEHAVELIPAIEAIFARSCRECHDSSIARPKGGFDGIMDLAALRENPDYLVPGEPMDSELYLLIIDPEPDFRMPPVDSEHPQVTRAEARLIEQWILGGAPASADTFATGEEEEETEEAAAKEAIQDETPPPSSGFDIGRTFAKAHPLLVHFPIALLFAGILAEFLRFARKGSPRMTFAASWCLWLGTAGAIISVWSGWLNADVAGHSDPSVFFHRWSGVTVAALAVIVLAVRSFLGNGTRKTRIALFALLVALVAGIIATGHSGGELVYGEGYFPLFPFR